MRHFTPRVGLEPTTPRLTAVCSTIELSRNTINLLFQGTYPQNQIPKIFIRLLPLQTLLNINPLLSLHEPYLDSCNENSQSEFSADVAASAIICFSARKNHTMILATIIHEVNFRLVKPSAY